MTRVKALLEVRHLEDELKRAWAYSRKLRKLFSGKG
jgi:hypothetical protein